MNKEEYENKIINLTQHFATPEQREAGVVDLSEELREELVKMLTFNEIPDRSDLEWRARSIAWMARRESGVPQRLVLEDELPRPKVMIGGAPFFMSTLEKVLTLSGFYPVYAFSKRESVEVLRPDGSVEKRNVFKHAGFVRAWGGRLHYEEKDND